MRFPDRPLPSHLHSLDHAHPYLAERGVSTSTARTFGIGFYGGPGLMHRRVVIPIRNDRHDLLAYAGRSINGEERKYRFPAGFHKSQVLSRRQNPGRPRTGADVGKLVKMMAEANVG
jgi:hypothetical protein